MVRERIFLDGVHGLRAAAALSIVVFHSGASIAHDKYQGLTTIGKATVNLDAGVDLFFVISGFVISLPLFLGRQKSAGTYLTHRLLRIFPMSILTAAIFLISNWVIFGRDPGWGLFLSSFLLLPSSIDPSPIVLWTLKQELLFYFLFLVAFVRPKFGLALIFLWAFISLGFQGNKSTTLSWLFHIKNAEFAFGIVGAYLFAHHPIQLRYALMIAIAGMAMFAAKASGTVSIGSGHFGNILFLGMSGLAAVYGLACAQIRLPGLIMFIGTASYSIYLIHFFFVSIGNKILTRFLPELPGEISLLLLAAFASGGGCIYYLIFERPIEKWRKSLRSTA